MILEYKTFVNKNKKSYYFEVGEIANYYDIIGKVIHNGFLYVTIITASGEKWECDHKQLSPATPEEIKQYELECDANKYNI